MINYRNANIDDIETIKDLAIRLCKWESDSFDNRYDGNNPGSEQGIKMIDFAIKSKKYIVIIVEDNNKAIGFMIGGVSESAFYWNFSKIAELHKLFVEEKYRGKAIGEKLMNLFINFSIENNADRMEIFTFYENNVNNFYEKFGFKKEALFLRKDLT